jgi:hypothetical protein
MDLATLSKEYAWLWDVEHNGITVAEVGKREGLSPRRIRQGLARVRGISSDVGDTTAVEKLRPPHLNPISPIQSYTPQSACPHPVRFRVGSSDYCIVCSRSSHDGHPALIREWLTDPKPEPPPPAPPIDVAPPHIETRKERRFRLFGPPHQQTSAA